METYKLKNGKTLEIVQDNNPDSPREWDNMGTMICFHGRYNLGDKHNYDHRDYSGWEEMETAIIKNESPAVILPLYLYDHSGITISTSPFSCGWDSGQIGFIFVSKEKLRKEYGVKRITKDIIQKALAARLRYVPDGLKDWARIKRGKDRIALQEIVTGEGQRRIVFFIEGRDQVYRGLNR